MKNLLYKIIIILLLGTAAFLLFGQNKVEAPEVVEESPVAEEAVNEPEVVYDYSVDTERSEIEWVAGKKFLVDWIDKGMISLLSGGFTSDDGEDGEGGGLIGEFVVDMTSIEVTETGSGGGFNHLMNHLAGEDFFDVENHPTAILLIPDFPSTAEWAEGNLSGDLTIREITAPATLSISDHNMEEMYYMGSMTVNRLDHGINFNSEGLIGQIENQVINDTFDLNFKIYYTEN